MYIFIIKYIKNDKKINFFQNLFVKNFPTNKFISILLYLFEIYYFSIQKNMGNIQKYCGDQCLSKEQLLPGSERILKKPKYVLNDQQEFCLNKVVNAWKHYKRQKSDPYIYPKLKAILENLDKTISQDKGTFLSLEDFETKMHPLVFLQYQKLAKAEYKSGFKIPEYNYKSEETTISKDIEIPNHVFLRRPVHLFETGEIYFGFWNLKGEMEGYGKIVTKEGLVIEGDWQKQGYCTNGRIFFKNGTFYQGGLMQFSPSNKGTLNNFYQCLYNGEWHNGEYDGVGQLLISKQCRYEGDFRNSVLFGKGKLIYESDDGQSYNYNGDFENNLFSGFGQFQFYKSKMINVENYTGNWKNGSPSGKGSYTWPSGNKFQGNYEDGKKKGLGKYIFNNGKCYYDGSWSNGKPNGKGVLVIETDDKNGPVRISGMWKLGKAQKIDSEEEFKKINCDETQLNIPVENEIFAKDFLLSFEYITPKKENIEDILNNSDNGKLQYEHTMGKGFYKGLYKVFDKNNVFSTNVLNGKQ